MCHPAVKANRSDTSGGAEVSEGPRSAYVHSSAQLANKNEAGARRVCLAPAGDHFS